MEKLGIRGNILTLLTSYLTDRKQCVSISNTISNFKTVEFGVPQGTVLGPILFNIYINNLFQLDTCGSIIGFADDTAILYTAENWEKLINDAQRDFKQIKDWFDSRLLTINFKKTKFLPFKSFNTNFPNETPLKINCDGTITEIPSADNIKYLGIYLDSKLKWDVHINKLVVKIRSMLAKFKYLKQFVDVKNLMVLYYALVESQLRYGIVVWGAAYKNSIKRLETIQKWILKIIYGKEITYPSDELFSLANVLDIRQLSCLSLILEQKKNMNKSDIQHNYQTRYREMKVTVPFTSKLLYKDRLIS